MTGVKDPRTRAVLAVSASAAAALAASLLISIAGGKSLQAAPGAKGKIAFASDRAGSMDIWVMNADGTNPVQLTNDPHNELEPAWSPDGKKIAFDRFKLTSELGFVPGSGEIYMVGENGKSLTNLTKCPGADDEHPDWSPR